MSGRLIQVSDVHFGRENAAAAEAALELTHVLKPDLTLVTGDVTQSGRSEEFEAAARWIDRLANPTFVVVGNHDVPYFNVWHRLFSPWKAFEATIGHPAHDHQWVGDQVMVRGVTTARGWQARLNWSKGVIDLDQTRRAAEALRAAPTGVLRVLACHHPLIEMANTPVTGDVRRGDAAAMIFAEAGVDLILTGHVHVPFATPIPLADHASYAVGCGTLSDRERGAPASFNRIDWDDDDIVVTVMAWSGRRFEENQVWRLPRRSVA
ncbi:MAG: metallophosphoesterase [Caulobacteraceae bacterium]|nr:metallophosphoesterase [Caulobacteraceae bacterium]